MNESNGHSELNDVSTENAEAWVRKIGLLMRESTRKSMQMELGKRVAEAGIFKTKQFGAGNVREIMRWRAEILEHCLGLQGHKIDHVFGPRRAGAKIRVGVMMRHFRDVEETHQALAAYRALDRTKFEVVLIGLGSSIGPMEKVCKESADRFLALPVDFRQQAGLIRDSELDVLLIGSDVTSVADGFTLLAAHRLARLQMALACNPINPGMWHIDRHLTAVPSGDALVRALEEKPPAATEKLFAVTAVRNGGFELLPHWLDHYREMGADELVVVVLRDDSMVSGLDEIAASRPFRRFDYTPRNIAESDEQFPQGLGLIWAGARPTNWVLWTDLDEFHDFGRPVREVIAEADQRQCDVIGGYLLDHFAADRSLVSTRAEPSIWEQYPKTGHLTDSFGGTACKVMLARFRAPVSIGHHHAAGISGRYDARYVVHHFKWRGGLIERLKEGLDRFSDHTPKWQQETRRFLERYRATGRIELEGDK